LLRSHRRRRADRPIRVVSLGRSDRRPRVLAVPGLAQVPRRTVCRCEPCVGKKRNMNKNNLIALGALALWSLVVLCVAVPVWADEGGMPPGHDHHGMVMGEGTDAPADRHQSHDHATMGTDAGPSGTEHHSHMAGLTMPPGHMEGHH